MQHLLVLPCGPHGPGRIQVSNKQLPRLRARKRRELCLPLQSPLVLSTFRLAPRPGPAANPHRRATLHTQGDRWRQRSRGQTRLSRLGHAQRGTFVGIPSLRSDAVAPPIQAEPSKVGDLTFPHNRSPGVLRALRPPRTHLLPEGEGTSVLGLRYLGRVNTEDHGRPIRSCTILRRGTGNTTESRLGTSSWVVLPTTALSIHMLIGTLIIVPSAATSRTGGSSGTSGSSRGELSCVGDRSLPCGWGGSPHTR